MATPNETAIGNQIIPDNLSKFEAILQSLKEPSDPNISKMLDLNSLILDDSMIAMLVIALKNNEYHLTVFITVNLTSSHSNIEILKPLLRALNKNAHILIFFEPKEDVCLEKAKALIENFSSDGSHENAIYLDLSHNDFIFWDFKKLHEFLEHYKNVSTIQGLLLWNQGRFQIPAVQELVKDWNDVKKQEFIKIWMMAEEFNIVNHMENDPFPFELTADQYMAIFLECEHRYPDNALRTDARMSGLIQLGRLPKSASYIVKVERVIQRLQAKQTLNSLPFTPFVKSENAKSRLLALNKEGLPPIFEISISLSELDAKELKDAAGLLKSLKGSVAALKIDVSGIDEKEQAEKLILFLCEMKENVPFESLAFENMADFKKLSFDRLMDLTEVLCQLSWLEFLFMSDSGLQKLNDEQFLTWFDKLLTNKNLRRVTIAQNEIVKRDFSFLNKIYEKIVNSPLDYMSLWDEYDIVQANSGEKWDPERCSAFAKLCMKLYQHSIPKVGHSYDACSKPFYGVLENNEETFQLIQEMIMKTKSIHFAALIQFWVQNYNFSYQQRKQLMLYCFDLLKGIGLNVCQFKLEPEDRLQAFLVSCFHYGYNEIINIKYAFNLVNVHTMAENFLNPWGSLSLISKDADQEWQFISLDDLNFSELKSAVHSTLIPELMRASERHFGVSGFYVAGFKKITQFKVQDDDMHGLKKWLLLLQWYTWFMAKLVILPDEQLNLNASNSTVVSLVFKEIVDYSENEMRYHAGKLLIECLLNNKEQGELYLKIVSSSARKITESKKIIEHETTSHSLQPAIYKSFHLLPALFLCKIMAQNDFPRGEAPVLSNVSNGGRESKESKDKKDGDETGKMNSRVGLLTEIAVDSLQQLSSDFAVGNNARAFVGSLQTLTNTSNLTAKQKLLLVKNLIGYDDRKVHIEKALKEYFYQLKHKVSNIKPKKKSHDALKPKITTSFVLTGEALQLDLKKILEEYTVSTLVGLPASYAKLFSQDSLQTPIDFITVDINVLSRTIIASFANLYHVQELRRQMANWYLMQGLGLLNELHHLADIPPSNYKKSIYNVIQTIFKLNEPQMDLYPTIFGGKRNEAALFTYLGKIQCLESTQRLALEKRYRESIGCLLSKESKVFYEKRYNPSTNPHLAKVFECRPDLRNLWSKNIELDFGTFLKQHNIHGKNLDIDYVKFIQNKIFRNNHYPVTDCVELKKYLDAQDVKAKQEIKQALLLSIQAMQEYNAKLERTQPAPRYFKLCFQRELIHLIEAPMQNKAEQLKCIRAAKQYLLDLKGFFEFSKDLDALKRGIETSNQSQEMAKIKDWKLKFTDDFWDLFMAGTDVDGSCLRVNGDPNLNKRLWAYVEDGKNKMIAIQDETGKTVARCIIRLLLDQNLKNPVLFIEEMYPFHITAIQKLAIEGLAMRIADDFGITLLSAESAEDSVQYENPVESIYGMGPEYVDAISRNCDDGIFIIESSYIFHSPFTAWLEIIESHFNQNVHHVKFTKPLRFISNTIAGYIGLEQDQTSLKHFQWSIQGK